MFMFDLADGRCNSAGDDDVCIKGVVVVSMSYFLFFVLIRIYKKK